MSDLPQTTTPVKKLKMNHCFAAHHDFCNKVSLRAISKFLCTIINHLVLSRSLSRDAPVVMDQSLMPRAVRSRSCSPRVCLGVCCCLTASAFSPPPPGYRCFKAVLFLTGLMFGSVVIFMLCYKERVMDTQLSVEASVGIGLGIGTLCGLVTMLVRSVGLFMVGLLLGLLLGVASLVVRHPVSAD